MFFISSPTYCINLLSNLIFRRKGRSRYYPKKKIQFQVLFFIEMDIVEFCLIKQAVIKKENVWYGIGCGLMLSRQGFQVTAVAGFLISYDVIWYFH